jgi:tetratricopeptide (TPR) repeat protein
VSQAGEGMAETHQVLLSRGIALFQQGRFAEAETIFREILRTQASHFDALHLLGVIALQTNRAERAMPLIEQAIKLNPWVASVHCDLGMALQALHRHEEALASYDRAIALQPDIPETHNNRGNLLRVLRRHEEALACFDQAITLRPDYAVAYRNRGIVLRELHRYADALASYDKAVALRPDFAEAHRNRGLVLRDLDRLEEALASYDRAIAAWPEHAAAHGNRSVVLQDVGRHRDALDGYAKAIALRPYDPDENWNHGLCLLLLGEFERGWRQYEWRKRRNPPVVSAPYRQPAWSGGRSAAGKTLFLYWEQGFGDTIQFYRYVRLVRALGATVVLSVQDALLRLIRHAQPDLEVIGETQVPAAFDYHCPLMSLPLAIETRLGSIPTAPRYLWAEEQLKLHWQARLPDRTRPKVGIAWSGSREHDIRNRSMDLRTFLPLLSDDVEWINLQKEIVADETDALRTDGRIAHFGEALTDFSETAALLDLMDLVITVDTSVAHLAGAMGKPVWIMLPYNADWRWLLDRSDSPWYPSARLFRQSAIGDWDGVVHRIRSELRGLIDAGTLA